MADPTRAKLTKRWSAAQIEMIESLLQHSPIDFSAIEQLAGRTSPDDGGLIDLRAFPFSKPVDQASIDEVDMSHGHWSPAAAFTRVQATRCKLASMRLSTALAYRFDRCDFGLTTFSECIGMPDTVFDDCNFEGARFRAGQFHACHFRRCSFSRARIPRTDFEDCVFEQCRFDDVEFKNGSFGRCRFVGLRTNLTYIHLVDRSRRQYIGDANFPTVDLGETNMIGATFE